MTGSTGKTVSPPLIFRLAERSSSLASHPMISVLLVDSCEIVRVGIRAVLAQATGIRLVDEATSGAQAIQMVARHKPTVVMMETSLPEGSSILLSRAIRQSSQTSRVLFFGAFIDQAALRATALGEADGYLLKAADTSEVIRAVRIVAERHTYLDPRLAKQILDTHREIVQADSTAKPVRLSDQELKVVAYLAEGKTNKEIAVLVRGNRRPLAIGGTRVHDRAQCRKHRRSSQRQLHVLELRRVVQDIEPVLHRLGEEVCGAGVGHNLGGSKSRGCLHQRARASLVCSKIDIFLVKYG